MGKATPAQQLDFMNSILKEEARDIIFHDQLLDQFKNIKYLRTCIKYSEASEQCKIEALDAITDTMELVVNLAYKTSRYNPKLRKMTLNEFKDLLKDQDGLFMDEYKTFDFLKPALSNQRVKLMALFMAFKDLFRQDSNIRDISEIDTKLKRLIHIIYHYALQSTSK